VYCYCCVCGCGQRSQLGRCMVTSARNRNSIAWSSEGEEHHTDTQRERVHLTGFPERNDPGKFHVFRFSTRVRGGCAPSS